MSRRFIGPDRPDRRDAPLLAGRELRQVHVHDLLTLIFMATPRSTRDARLVDLHQHRAGAVGEHHHALADPEPHVLRARRAPAAVRARPRRSPRTPRRRGGRGASRAAAEGTVPGRRCCSSGACGAFLRLRGSQRLRELDGEHRRGGGRRDGEERARHERGALVQRDLQGRSGRDRHLAAGDLGRRPRRARASGRRARAQRRRRRGGAATRTRRRTRGRRSRGARRGRASGSRRARAPPRSLERVGRAEQVERRGEARPSARPACGGGA